MSDLRTSREPVAKELLPLIGDPVRDSLKIRLATARYLLQIAHSAPSPGYEALLIKRGEKPLIARAKAYTTLSEGRKIADECRRYRDVVAAIRFLAKPNRSRWAVNRKIGLLLVASQETRIIRTIFINANLSDHLLVRMLPSAGQGNQMVIERIFEIARMAPPRIRIPRGPKVTAASAAHELFLEKHGVRGASAYSYRGLEEDFVDEATRATRLEFPDRPFGPQPASRRLKARRRLGGVPVPTRSAKPRSQKSR